MNTLTDLVHSALPQTQCTQCGFSGCRPYAEALVEGSAEINQCPPGGAAGIEKLAQLLQRPVLPLNPAHGQERPRQVAYIVDDLCIGCTLCIQACPVDAIAGAAKYLHTVIVDDCTGCELCVAPCPVDCIVMRPTLPDGSAVQAWTAQDAQQARHRHEARQLRLVRERQAREERSQQHAVEKLASETDQRKRAIIMAAIERAQRRVTSP
jgi:electron transport complex protein RnfB